MNRTWIIRALLMMSPALAAGAKKPKTLPTDLPSRYARLSCAVVQIVHNQGSGTGFFVSPDGELLTAAHVALDRVFSEPAPGQIRVDVDYKPGLRIRAMGGQMTVLQQLPKLTSADARRATSDLVLLRTGVKTPCFLKLGMDTADFAVGTHLIAMGYPESAPDGALYEGFVSARYKHLPIPIAIVNGKPLYPDYDVIRIQMPITPGASGGPVIADDDDVMGVITENPTVWFNDLNALIEYGQQENGGFNAPVSDVPKMLAKLAWVVHEFVSSGAGLAVPISYLEVAEQTGPLSGPPKAKGPAPQEHRGWFRALVDHLK